MEDKRILVCGEYGEHNAVISILKELGYIRDGDNCCHCVDDCDEFQAKMVDIVPSLTIVAMCGTAGMDAVRIAKRVNPDVPVFWFSDDNKFVMQSYRLECDYFSEKPITKSKILNAFRRCAHIGIRI